MKRQFALALAGAWLVPAIVSAQFASSVVGYAPGVVADASFTIHPDVALGAPSQVNPFAELVDPFNPPYGSNQVLSVGAGGSLTVRFTSPILDDPAHPYGLDFNLFGNSGFIITNEFNLETFEWVGTPATDGSLFGANSGTARVWVSADGVNYFLLDAANARPVDGLFPTDGGGNFAWPVNPSLAALSFAGQTLAGIRTLYNGSAGGTGFDLSWARDGNGDPVALSSVGFVRVEVLSGKAEIDAFAVVPEPTTVVLLALGGVAWLAIGRRQRT